MTLTNTNPGSRNGGQILIQQLRNHGARRIFLVPGESYLLENKIIVIEVNKEGWQIRQTG